MSNFFYSIFIPRQNYTQKKTHSLKSLKETPTFFLFTQKREMAGRESNERNEHTRTLV